MHAKILIVGGGVVGTSIAMHAARDRDPLSEPVVLLEKSDLAAGASGRSAGVVHQWDERRDVAGMARDSLHFYRTFRSRMGRSVGFRSSGVLTLAGPGRRAEALETAEMLAGIGIELKILQGSALEERVPNLTVPDGSVGIFERSGGFIDPDLTISSFAALARFYGANTRIGVEVLDLIIENGRVRGAVTTEGEYEADQVVLAAGPWIKALAAKAGVELPLRSVRSEHHYMASPYAAQLEDSNEEELALNMGGPDEELLSSEEPRPVVPHPVLFDLDNGFCVRSEPERQRTRVGRLTFEETSNLADPDDLNEVVTKAASQELRRALLKLMPNYKDQVDLGSQATWFTLTPDNRGIAGAVPGVEGLYVASGFTNHDYHVAPSIGEGVAQMLRGEPVSAFDPSYFALDRFAAVN